MNTRPRPSVLPLRSPSHSLLGTFTSTSTPFHLRRRHRVILFLPLPPSLSLLFHFLFSSWPIRYPHSFGFTITLLRLTLLLSIRLALLGPTPFSTVRSRPFQPYIILFPARYSEAFTTTLISTFDFRFFGSYFVEPRLPHFDLHSPLSFDYSWIYTEHNRRTARNPTRGSSRNIRGTRRGHHNDCGLERQRVRSEARGCGSQDVLDTIPNGVKLGQQHICISKASTKKHTDPAAEKPKTTTGYSGSIVYT